MLEESTTALAPLRELGSVDQMRAFAAKGLAPSKRLKCNLHVHLPPNFSAFTSVEQAVRMASRQDVGVLGGTNYYDFDVYSDFVAHARAYDIFPIFGLEILTYSEELARDGIRVNDPDNPGRRYICGKGITRWAPMSDTARRLMGGVRDNDSRRITEMTDRLAKVFAAGGLKTNLDAETIIDDVRRRHGCRAEQVALQERHVAMAFQEAFFEMVPVEQRAGKLAGLLGTDCRAEPEDAVAVQGAIRTHLMKSGKVAFVPEKFINFEQAVKLILALDGFVCHPTLLVHDGTEPICEYERPVKKLIERIKDCNIHSTELVSMRNTPPILAECVRAMRDAGLVVTAGTEHNTLEMLPIDPTCHAGKPIPDETAEILWEGTAVVAAHQFLRVHGECGFTDTDGQPNPDYKDTEQRIAAFRALGEAVIQRYRQMSQSKQEPSLS
ncbi:MAG: hypothetical protein SVT52_03700 [Planctomycetota bacterium]|nr:hypothetical protein [Planctomycetota bacterium]